VEGVWARELVIREWEEELVGGLAGVGKYTQ
jgi:hypothetical protein